MYYRVEVFSPEANLWYGWTSLKGLGTKILGLEEAVLWRAYCVALPKPRWSQGLPHELWMTEEGYLRFQLVEPIFRQVLQSSPFTDLRVRQANELPGVEICRDADYVEVIYMPDVMS